jgi:phosphoglycolate phosphatase-like HAD superfamily hydrolase
MVAKNGHMAIALSATTRAALLAAGAHLVIDTVADLPTVLDQFPFPAG